MAKLLLPCAENIVTQWVHFPQQASIFRTIVNLLTAKMKATPPRTGTAFFFNCNAVTLKRPVSGQTLTRRGIIINPDTELNTNCHKFNIIKVSSAAIHVHLPSPLH